MNLGFAISILSLCFISSVAFGQRIDTTNNKPNTGIPTSIMDMPPQYPGGLSRASAYIAARFNYPKEINPRPKGTIVLSFFVDRDGSIKDVALVEKLHPLLDEEAVKVVQEMPKWTPGVKAGRLVKTNYKLPIIMD